MSACLGVDRRWLDLPVFKVPQDHRRLRSRVTGLMETKLTRDNLLYCLDCLAQESDAEEAHERADALLLKFIADDEITDAFERVRKWYG